MKKDVVNILELVFWLVVFANYSSFLWGQFHRVETQDHKMCPHFILLTLPVLSNMLQDISTSLFPSFSPAPTLKDLSHFCFCYQPCFLTCIFLPTGQEEVVTPPGGSQNNINPTDCQIFTLTPPPTTRNPSTRVPPIPRTPRYPFNQIPQRRPGVYFRFPNRPFLPLRCNHRFQFQPFRWPQGRLTSRRYFLGRNLQTESSSEESREKREA